jgi:hypothetical protein
LGTPGDDTARARAPRVLFRHPLVARLSKNSSICNTLSDFLL